MSDSQLNVRKLVTDCLRKIGLPEPCKPEQFWKRLEKKHGKSARDFGNAVAKRGNGEVGIDPYDLKNASEQLSLDITAQYESKLYRDFSEWLANEHLESITTILDLGCGNGVMSILLSTMYPKSKIVAIDVNARGVEIGRSVAKRLGLINIEWHVGDVTALATELRDRSFDLVIAMKLFFEVLDRPELAAITGHSIAAFRQAPTSDRNLQALGQVARYMSANSQLICIDRWSTPESFAWWVQTAGRSGLSISLDKSYILKTKENDTPETFPVSVFFIESNLTVPSDDQLLGFFAYPALNEVVQKLVPLEGATAEAFFLSFGDRMQICTFVATWKNGSGIQRTSLFISGSLSGIYTTWSTGRRSLYLAPAVAIKTMIAHFYEMIEGLQSVCDLEIEEFDHTDLLEQFGLSPIATG